ncbi:MAG: T9SS type A sorting domain-containing protein [Bacteroidales bacterium]|nr:T9SS type A sorting domain-containing protein [Bacteroidales bacterium]
MKRLIHTIVVIPFFFYSLVIDAQSYLDPAEGFEHGGSAPSGWTEEYVNGTASWVYKEGGLYAGGENHPDTAFAGSYNAAFIYSTSYTTKLVSPSLDLADALKPALIFGHAMQKYGSDIDELYIYFRNGIDSTWMLLKEYTLEVPEWIERTIYLPDSILTNDCYIAFEAVSKFGAGVCIDSVRVEEKGFIPKRINDIKIKGVTTNFIPTNSLANKIMQINFQVVGNNGDVVLDSIAVKSLNTSDNDISLNGVKLYFTEDTIFATTNEIGASNFIDGVAIFDNLSQSLPYDWSSIWVCYDIGLDSTHKMHNHTADAMIEANGIKIGNYKYPFADKSPEGSRIIYESIFIDGFEEENGWILTGEFERGAPQGLGSGGFYNPDPLQAYNGNGIIGTDLSGLGGNPGDYEPNLSSREYSATSPSFNARYFKDVSLVFQKMLNFDSQDSAYIELSTNNGTNWTNIWKSSGYYNDKVWVETNFDVSNTIDDAQNGKIRFTIGPTDATYQAGGWNIDDIVFVGDYISKDVGVTDWLSPLDGCGHTDEEYVELTITNFAGDTLKTPLPISFSFDGGTTIYKDTIEITNIVPGNSINHTILNHPIDLTNPGWYNNVYATTNLPGDEVSSNNRLNKILFITPTCTLPYTQNFESNYGYFISGGTNSTWEYGIPDGLLIDTAFSGTKAWVTNLDGYYLENESSYLESPCFDFTGNDSIIFEFKCIGESEDKVDGMAVMYSFDEGQTWNFMPDDHDYYWEWYNEPFISELGTAGIDSAGSSWITMRQLLPKSFSDKSSVKFRYVLESDFTSTLEGFGIDDIKIYDAPYDVGVSSLSEPITQCELGDATQVKVYVENYGITPVKSGTKIPLTLNFESEITNDTLILASDLVVGASVMFTFGSTVDMSYAGDYDFVINTKLESNQYFYNETLSNDTLSTTVTVQGMPNYDIGWIVGSDDVDTLLDAGAGYNFYSWEFNSSVVSTNQTYRATAEGIYYVTVTNADACEADDSLKVVQSTIDVKMDSIRNAPVDECERFDSTIIQAAIANIGLVLNVDDTIPFGYQINNLPPVLDTLTLTRLFNTTSPDDTITFTFGKKCDLMEPGEYTISVFTNFASDLNRNNDTITTTINTWGLPEINLAYDTIYSSQADTLTLDAGAGFASYNWNTGVSTQTVTPGNVSYYYKVTVTDIHSCGSDKDSTYIETHDLGISAVTSPANICEDLASATTSINVEVTNYSDSVYNSSNVKIFYKYDTDSWVEVNPALNVGASASVTINSIGTIDAMAVGEHMLKLYTSSEIDANHTNDTLEYSFETWPNPHVDLAYDTIFTTQADTVILVAQEEFATYVWSDATTNDSLVVTDKFSQNYIVTVTDEHGCGSDEDSTQIITYNVGINELVSPLSACEHTSSENVIISVKNYSQDILLEGTIIPIGYILEGEAPVEEDFALPSDLNPSETVNATFNDKVDVSEINTHKFKLYTAFKLDVVASNDTLVDAIKTFGYPEIELGDDIYTTEPETLTLAAPSGYNNYKWDDGTNTNTLSVTYPASKLYSVTVTDINGCATSDDINVYTYNVAASNLNTPFSQCELTATEDVNIDVVNNSSDTLLIGETIDIRYILNSGSLVSESFNLADTLFPAETVNRTFTQQADLSVNQVHELKVFAKLSSIDVELDDTITSNVDYQKPDFDLGADVNVGTEEYTITAEAGYSSYLWFDNITTTNTYTVNVNNQNPNYYYAVTVTNSYGCSADDSIQVTFSTTPDLELTNMTTPVSACWNESETYPVHIVITNSGVVNLNPGTNFTVGYRIDGGTAVTETYNLSTAMNASDTREHTFADEISFATAKVYEFKTFVKHAEDGNVSNDTLTISDIDISAPVVDLGVNDTVYFEVSYEISTSESYASYEWSDGSTGTTLTVTETGHYSVTVTDAIGCQGEGSIYCEKLPVGIDNLIQGDGYKITYYPNPASEKLMIQFDNKKSTDVIIEIISANGQVLYNNKLSNVENTIERIDVNPYANGVYYLRFIINQDFYVRKLIIQ